MQRKYSAPNTNRRRQDWRQQGTSSNLNRPQRFGSSTDRTEQQLRAGTSGSGRKQQQQGQRQQYPVGFEEVEKIRKDIEQKQLLVGSGELLAKVNANYVFLRMNDLWREPDKQAKFLHVLVEAVRANHQEDLRATTQQFLRQVLFKTNMIDTLVKQHIAPMPTTPAKRTPVHASIAESICWLLSIGWETFPTSMETSFNMITLSLREILTNENIQSDQFPTPKIKELLERINLNRNEYIKIRNAEALEHKDDQQNEAEKTQKKGPADSFGPPPQDFREISVIPNQEDVLCPNQNVYLRKAIIDGTYENDEHYLDVQFRLMREDLYRPLRDGIRQFRDREQAGRGGKTDLYVYTRVKIIGWALKEEIGQLLAYAELNKRDRQRRMHKRLMFGALVCFSADNFHNHFMFGTVTDRDKFFETGLIGVTLFDDEQTHRPPDTHPEMELSLVESPAFYEAYKHVLSALKAIPHGDAIPFSKYLVHLDPDVSLPNYQLDHLQQHKELDFSCLFTKEAKARFERETKSCKSTSQQIKNHFTPTDFGMDNSQFEALSHTLQSEFAVIQGPPGTGKTYLGLRVVELLFANEQLWARDRIVHQEPLRFQHIRDAQAIIRRPLLVVCYTNHALDQFLEGMIPFLNGEGIVRVGGRCKNKKLEEFTLNVLRSKERMEFFTRDERIHYYQCRDRMKEVLKNIHVYSGASDLFLPYRQLRDVVEAFDEELKIRRNSATNVFSRLLNENGIYRWLVQAQPHRNSVPYEMDIHLIRHLTEQLQLDEWTAKAISCICADWPIIKQQLFEMEKREHFETFYQYDSNLRTQMNFLANSPEFQLDVDTWPTLQQLNQLRRNYGFDDFLAIEWLTSDFRSLGTLQVDFQRQRLEDNEQDDDANEQIPMEFFDEREQEERMIWDGPVDDDIVAEEKMMASDEEAGEEGSSTELEEPDTERQNYAELEQKWEKKFSIKEWSKRTFNLRQRFGARASITTDEDAFRLALLSIDNPWGMSLEHRWTLYHFWIHQYTERERPEHQRRIQKYCDQHRQYQELRNQADVALLKKAKVIGMTTTGAARLQSTLRSLKPRIVVVEEAAEVFEPHILTSLTECCEHLILIGDHQQLRPNPAHYHLGRQFHLDISMFERLVRNAFQFRILTNQHRMRPEISRTLMPHFYPELQDDPSVNELENVLGMQKNIFFLNHSNPERIGKDGNHDKSHSNPFEAEFVVRIAEYLSLQNYGREQITILCTYVEQMFEVRNLMSARHPLEKEEDRIRIDVVDNYQGEECDIILLSLVRSLHPENKIGFLNIPNRVCVAMSRAKQGFYVLGNFDYLADNCHGVEPDLWKNIRQSVIEAEAMGEALPIQCQLHGNQQLIHSVAEFDEKTLEGGCSLPCQTRLNCGHVCRKTCHAYDPKHERIPCQEDCERLCENGHKCPNRCYQECKKCEIKVTKKLNCGHETKAKCHLPIELIECDEPCMLTLNCGHQCAGKCSAMCPRCLVPVEKQLLCGHFATIQCCKPVLSYRCMEEVEKEWPVCHHKVKVKCHQQPELEPCPMPCGAMVPTEEGGCGHMCKGTCGQCRNGRLHIECTENCTRTLICGHQCDSKCSRTCPPCQKPCETACGHSQCGMVAIGGEKQKKLRKKAKKEKGRCCGDPCPPCKENCLNICEHRKCEMKCDDICDVPTCGEPCRKLLKCAPKPESDNAGNIADIELHRCIGLCGEDCIQLCRICEPEKFAEQVTEVFFGTEDEDGARFVQLKDCGHILEFSGLDHWIEQQTTGTSGAIVQITCPKCKTPIRRSKRYVHLLNKRAKQIELIKQKIIGQSKKILIKEWTVQLKRMNGQLTELIEAYQYAGMPELRLFSQQMECIKDHLMKDHTQIITSQWMTRMGNVEKILNEMQKIVSDTDKKQHMKIADPKIIAQLTEFKIDGNRLKEYLLEDLLELLDRLHGPGEKGAKITTVSESVLVELSSELARNHFMLEIFTSITATNLDGQQQEILLQILIDLHNGRSFSDNREQLDNLLKQLADRIPGFAISHRELVQINRALTSASETGQWYQCSKGHPYRIGNCGQAMQKSECPECHEVIGGQHHQLVGTSRTAPQLREGMSEVPLNPFQVYFQ